MGDRLAMNKNVEIRSSELSRREEQSAVHRELNTKLVLCMQVFSSYERLFFFQKLVVDNDFTDAEESQQRPMSQDPNPNSSKLAEEQPDFFQKVADNPLLPPNLKLTYLNWEGEIPHAFGLQSTQGTPILKEPSVFSLFSV